MANLLKEVWVQDIQEVLYPSNSILLKSTDHSSFVHNNVVHIPSAGSNAGVQKNRPAGTAGTAGVITDHDVTYVIDSYSVDPIVISDLETYQIAYEKRKSVMYNALKNLETTVTNNFLYQIAPSSLTGSLSGSVCYTSGALQTDDLAYNYSGATATGGRSGVTMTDIFKLKTILDKQNVPDDGNRVLLVPADMFNNELLMIPNILQSYQLGAIGLNESVAATGVLAKVAGFNIMVRPTTVNYTSGGTLATVSAIGEPSVAATDCKAIMAWHPSTVAHAKGEILVYAQENNPLYYGTVLSFNVYEGAKPLRYDGKGIAMLVQKA